MDKIGKAWQIAREATVFHVRNGYFHQPIKDYYKGLLREHPINHNAKTIAKAKTNLALYDALVEFCADLIENGEKIPEAFTDFAVSVFRGKTKRPTKPGPHPTNFLPRDLSILLIIYEVVRETGIPASRNDASDESIRFSACDIVSETLKKECNLDLGYEAVKKIFFRYNKDMPYVEKIIEKNLPVTVI